MSHDPLAGLDEPGDGMMGDAASGDDAGKTAIDPGLHRPAAGGSAVVTLESTLTIAESAELHEILLDHVRAMVPLTINAADVEVVDTAGLQLVAATLRTASEKGLSARLDAPSACFVSAARQVGLDVLFGLDDGSRGA